jgi:hypothetical protein
MIEGPRGGRPGVSDAGTLVAGIGEEALEEWEALGDAVENQRRAIAILHTGGVDLDAQHEAEHVGHEVAFATLDPLSGVETDHFAGFHTSPDALAVDDRRSRALFAPLQLPAAPVEHVMDMRPNPGRDPRPE